MHRWVAGPVPRDVEAALARLVRAEDVQHVAVMPDVHLASSVCVGCVVATGSLLYPDAVGGDIGGGMAALRFLGDASILASEAAARRLLARLAAAVPALRRLEGRRAPAPPEALDPDALSAPGLRSHARREGLAQLGTLGRGNHFLELQRDDEDGLWLMVHSGSRAMGPAIRDHHLRSATRRSGGMSALDAASDVGQRYLRDVAWALAYAAENRRLIVEAVVEVLSDRFGVEADATSFIACHHNHVRQEIHAARTLWVHRKGAISARAGEPGIIPGSMGSPSHHVEGRGHADALCSSAHGAGRALRRGEAFRAISTRDLERQMRGIWFDVTAAPRLRDEAPAAYKDIGVVMRAQRELTRVVRRLRPVLCYKGV
jgi:tRNA-splicing ligase RtcB